jgi:2,5-dihydroxypyridine 5,6-dioxygenase
MPRFYEYELGVAGDTICHELFELKRGETLVVTADTESDERVADAIARAAFSCGAKPIVAWTATPLGVSKAADPMLPVDSLTALLETADAWVELNNKMLLYSTVYERALAENPRLRHLCLAGADANLLVRCVGRIDFELLGEFQSRVADLTYAATHVRMTTPAGGDIEFDNWHASWGQAMPDLGRANEPGSFCMAGQISWPIVLGSVNGTVVFDGSIDPPFGRILSEPVVLRVQAGEILKIEGGADARTFDAWTRSFDHPQMRKLAHVCYGFNPGAKLSGKILEDERVWGASEWGIGYVHPDYSPGGIDGPSHCDGVCLETSVWLDGVQLMEMGTVLDPRLRELAHKLGK